MSGQYGCQLSKTNDFSLINNYIQTVNSYDNKIRIVDDFETIDVNEIPENGCAIVYLKSDNSEIQVKERGTDGIIKTTVYKTFLREKTECEYHSRSGLHSNVFDLSKDDIDERLEKIGGIIRV